MSVVEMAHVPSLVRAAVRRWGVWLLAAVMVAAAAPLLTTVVEDWSLDGLPELRWWVLVPVFALGEVLVIHLPTVRNAHTHSLREVPAIVGLALLVPGEYVSAYVLGSVLGLALGRGQRGVKLAFNGSMFALEAALGAVAYQALLGGAAPGEPRGWAAAFLTVLLTDLLSAVAVTAAISITEDRFDHEVLREAMGSGVVAAMVNTCLALIVVVLILEAPVALPLLAAALGMLVLAYRATVALSTGFSRLQHLYRFVGSTARPADLDAAVYAVLSDARRVLRAEVAEIVVLPSASAPGSRTVMTGDGPSVVPLGGGPEAADDDWWAPAAAGAPVLRVRPTTRGGDPGGRQDGMAAPLRSEDAVYGVLVVRGRTFQGETFTDQDLQLFETLAAHAAVALDKARLVDRLRRLAAQREHEARHDLLTGLPNRRAFHEAVSALVTARRTGAVLFLDLDDFKDVNDTLGHGAGDLLLEETGRRLQAVTDGVVARLGGDEFALLLPDTGASGAVEVARHVLDAVTRPVSVHQVTLRTGVSIGVALVGDHGRTTEEILRHADVAMYAAKNAGTGVEVYRPEDGQAVQRKLVLAADLPTAIDEHRFGVWYQPQADARTGRVVGMEALLRWPHAVYGQVPPPDVVALAERTGLIRRLTDAVLETALRQRAAWAAAGQELTVSVNVTAADLHDDRLPQVVARLLAATGTPPDQVTLEITESGVMSDPARCLAVLDGLADIGVRLAVDDFGTGYSSLAYLERLPVTEVKIDKSFVQALDDPSSDATVIRATVALAHDLGMQVVAEGIESPEAWSRLAALGCETVQGYALARPLPAADTLSWLAEYRSGLAEHRSGLAEHRSGLAATALAPTAGAGRTGG
jgi:diguanylate cyclase (GGDEF)-like protein